MAEQSDIKRHHPGERGGAQENVKKPLGLSYMRLLGLMSEVGEDAAVDVEDMTVHEIGRR